MNGYDAARMIEDIERTSSRTEKELKVKQLAETEIGKFIIHWAYNPFITFGVTPAPTEGSGRMEFRPSLVEKLLVKLAERELTGHAAEREIAETMQFFDKDGARLLYLILSKDLKCGIAEGIINSAVPGTIPVFSVQRAQTYEPKRFKDGEVYSGEFKLDGNRNTFLCHDNNGGFFTRSGKRVPQLDFLVPHIIKAASYAASASDTLRKVFVREGETKLNFMLDGEAMMGLFEDTGALRRKDTDALGAELHLYDIMSYDDFDAVGPVGEVDSVRREWLKEFVTLAKTALANSSACDAIQIVPRFFLNSDEEVQALFERARSMTLARYLARGNEEREAELLKSTIDKATGKPKVLEGIVVKNRDALYEKKKSYVWMKLKAEETLDLRIIGVYSGKPGTKYEHMLGGAIIDHNGVEVRVGGGWSDAEREEFWKLWLKDSALLGVSPDVGFKGQAFALTAIRAAGATNFLSRLLETEFMEETPDGSLRHPRAVRMRDDKDGEVEDKIAA